MTVVEETRVSLSGHSQVVMYFEVAVQEITHALKASTSKTLHLIFQEIEFRTRWRQVSQETNYRLWRLPKWMTAKFSVRKVEDRPCDFSERASQLKGLIELEFHGCSSASAN